VTVNSRLVLLVLLWRRLISELVLSQCLNNG